MCDRRCISCKFLNEFYGWMFAVSVVLLMGYEFIDKQGNCLENYDDSFRGTFNNPYMFNEHYIAIPLQNLILISK